MIIKILNMYDESDIHRNRIHEFSAKELAIKPMTFHNKSTTLRLWARTGDVRVHVRKDDGTLGKGKTEEKSFLIEGDPDSNEIKTELLRYQRLNMYNMTKGSAYCTTVGNIVIVANKESNITVIIDCTERKNILKEWKDAINQFGYQLLS